MNLRRLVPSILLVMLSPVACADREEDTVKSDFVIANAGFEEMATGERLPGWMSFQHAGEKSYVVSTDTRSPGKGRQSFRFEQIHKQHFGLLRQQLPATPDMVGKTLELSALMKASKVGKRGWNLWLSFYDASDVIVVSSESEWLTGSVDWRRVAVRGVVPAGTVKIGIGLQLADDDGDSGVGWGDDVRLNFVTPDAAAKP